MQKNVRPYIFLKMVESVNAYQYLNQPEDSFWGYDAITALATDKYIFGNLGSI